jgi:hypothetical protein
MHKITPMAVLMTLVAVAAFVAKAKASTYGFHVGN